MKYVATLFVLLLLVGCARTAVVPASGPHAPLKITLRTEVLLINGGSEKKLNYYSHLEHIRRLTELLLDSGVSRERISIFASDGPDSRADVAVREQGALEDYWLVEKTSLGQMLGSPLQYMNSTVDGMRLLPAKKAALQTWFHLRASQLKKGDTLLIYVTDHGQRGDGKTEEASISLWGEKLHVSDFIALLDSVDPEVRVVLWMSQCYSAAFDRAVYAVGDVLRQSACGFYSTHEDLTAWGCYPEATAEKDDKGHSFRFLEELARGGTFSAAHNRVLVSDRTLNVPNRSSDHYLERLLVQEAKKQQTEVRELTESLLEEAWEADGEFVEQQEIIELLALRAGIEPPRSPRDLDGRIEDLRRHQRQSETNEDRWEDVSAEIKKRHISRFTAQNTKWRARNLKVLLENHEMSTATEADMEESRLQLQEKLIADFKSYLEDNPQAKEQLYTFNDKQRSAAEIALRMQARKGAILRLRTILLSIAGEILARRNPDLEAGMTRLRRCEAWSLPGGPSKTEDESRGNAPAGFPPLTDDIAQIEEARPAWLGVHYIPESAEVREKLDLAQGAIAVSNVVEGSPAQSAGIRRGDTIFGVRGNAFEDTNELKEHVVLSHPGQSLKLDVIRDGKKKTIAAVLQPYPQTVPKPLPAPAAGRPAPSLAGLVAFEGSIPAETSPMLLAFFSTTCGPCKLAMGDLVKWEKKHSLPVVLISGEDEKLMSKWVKKWKNKPRPSRIALDQRGLVIDAYKAKAIPVFVLLDGKGKIQAVMKGFRKGLALPTP
jgi:thiol-disulfide isomerase/thioredoxin